MEINAQAQSRYRESRRMRQSGDSYKAKKYNTAGLTKQIAREHKGVGKSNWKGEAKRIGLKPREMKLRLKALKEANEDDQ
jgi:hypothetical protein